MSTTSRGGATCWASACTARCDRWCMSTSSRSIRPRAANGTPVPSPLNGSSSRGSARGECSARCATLAGVKSTLPVVNWRPLPDTVGPAQPQSRPTRGTKVSRSGMSARGSAPKPANWAVGWRKASMILPGDPKWQSALRTPHLLPGSRIDRWRTTRLAECIDPTE